MKARNCWTCAHDEKRKADSYVYHVCAAVWTDDLEKWIDRHVVPALGVAFSMPPRDAPPCPKWKPRGEA